MVLFYGHSSPFYILVANVMTTLDAMTVMTVGTITSVCGLGTIIGTICSLVGKSGTPVVFGLLNCPITGV